MGDDRLVGGGVLSGTSSRRGLRVEATNSNGRLAQPSCNSARVGDNGSSFIKDCIVEDVLPSRHSSCWDVRRAQTPPSNNSSPEWRHGEPQHLSSNNTLRGYSEMDHVCPNDPISGDTSPTRHVPRSPAAHDESAHSKGLGIRLGTYFSGAPVPAPVGSSPNDAFYVPSSRTTVSGFGSRNMLTADGRSWADLPLLLSSALSPRQITKVQSRMAASSGLSQNGVRIKMLELLEYWMGEEKTADIADGLIVEFFQKAGIMVGSPVMKGECEDRTNNSSEPPSVTLRRRVNRPYEQGVGNSVDAPQSPRSSSPSAGYVTLVAVDSDNIGSAEGDSGSLNPDVVREKREVQMRETFGQAISFPPSAPRSSFSRSFVANHLSDMRSVTSSVAGCSERVPQGPFSGCESDPSQASITQGASYQDIPPFYFPEGVPKDSEETLAGLTYTKHENPHLKLVEGTVVPATVCVDFGRHLLTMGGKPIMHDCGRSSVAVTLRAIDDKSVSLFIKREFSRLPAPPRCSQSAHHALGVHIRGFGTSNGLATKQSTNYNEQLVYVMQRICTQCLGLPKYFAFLVMGILRSNCGRDGVDSFPVSDSGSLPSRASCGAPSRGTMAPITAQQVLDLFENFLRGYCIGRRVFHLLILSSSTGAYGPKAGADAGGKWSSGTVTMPDRPYLVPEDFHGYIKVLLEHHPGLSLLKRTPDIQDKYMETVIYRIFYDLDRLHRGRITYPEMECSGFVDCLRQVDATDDINSVLRYFSYEHFYVLYCRFWELDTDRDMLLSRHDFMKYAPDGAMNPIIADRIFNGLGRQSKSVVKDRITYEEFVWFCLSEEDKTTPTAVRYWFSILDLDGDGVLSLYELQSFYDETRRIVLEHVPEGTMPFASAVCQIFDMLGVTSSRGIVLRDLLSNLEAAGAALNMLTNVLRLLQFDHRDPLVAHQDRLLCGVGRTHWDRFARAEYDRMAQVAANE